MTVLGNICIVVLKNNMETELFLFSVRKLFSRWFSSTSISIKQENVLMNAASVQLLQVFEILSHKWVRNVTLTFLVTWCHRSCDHSIGHEPFPIGVPLAVAAEPPGQGGQLTPHFFECGVNQCCLTPHFFMHKSMVASRFMETYHVITAAHYLKHPDGWKTPRHWSVGSQQNH